MTAAVRSVVVNAALCYLTNKCGRYASKQIKTIMLEFYSADCLASAKETLFECCSKFENLPKSIVRKRRDSKNRPELKINLDIDDLMSMMIFIDENEHRDKLPIFVTADPDLIPSPRMLEGDVALLLAKMSKLEALITQLQNDAEETRVRVASMAA